MSNLLGTERLTLRPWRPDDAEAAFGVFGSPDVARWLTPALPEIVDAAAMGLLIEQWLRDEVGSTGPVGRWAIELRAEHRVVGGVAALYLPPGGEDVEIGVQLAPGGAGPRIRQ
jgi:RimJ/RimL family protein N-acetyltransferase